MYSNDRLVILDADGTTIDAFCAIEKTFAHHGMDIGPLARFQKRRNIFKYLGGFKEMPQNLRQQIGWKKRTRLVATLTEVYREEARMFDGIEQLIHALSEAPDVRVGIVTRNITNDPLQTLQRLFERHDIEFEKLDFLVHLPLSEHKMSYFRDLRERFNINPARAYACGDEAKDYRAAVGTGMHPFMVSYGFEDFERLHVRHEIPAEVIVASPDALALRVTHALDLLSAVRPTS
jgi:phosphoglycolate phosphatase